MSSRTKMEVRVLICKKLVCNKFGWLIINEIVSPLGILEDLPVNCRSRAYPPTKLGSNPR